MVSDYAVQARQCGKTMMSHEKVISELEGREFKLNLVKVEIK